MRILFNHGLTIEELYTNTPQSITNKNWSWFIKRYKNTSSYSDALAEPFKYALGLIFNYILDNRVRFIIPNVAESYIDFEVVTDEMFVKQKQMGRFKEIDFIESDFTGYAVRYYFKARAYQKAYPIYFGGDLKKKFFNGINSGVKYYSVKDVTIKDFLPLIYEKFPELSQTEVKKLVLHGFRRMHSAIKYGCAISIQTKKYFNCTAHIGALYLNPEKQILEYSVRKDRKLRKIEGWKKTPFDGYYYIGLSPEALQNWIEVNRTSRSILKFSNVIPRKIKEELYYKNKYVYIFRFKRNKFKGWSFWAENLKLRNAEYIGMAVDRKFIPSNDTWKNLIKEYDKREC